MFISRSAAWADTFFRAEEGELEKVDACSAHRVIILRRRGGGIAVVPVVYVAKPG